MAFQTDFAGTLFCFAQLQIDSMLAGYESFLADPQMNLAKVLIAFFGLVNTSIILIQIHCLYRPNAVLSTIDSFDYDDS